MCEHQFVLLEEGTTIKGEHIHLYRCVYCGLFDYSIEA